MFICDTLVLQGIYFPRKKKKKSGSLFNSPLMIHNFWKMNIHIIAKDKSQFFRLEPNNICTEVYFIFFVLLKPKTHACFLLRHFYNVIFLLLSLLY